MAKKKDFLREAVALEGYTLKSLSEKIGVDLEDARVAVNEVLGRRRNVLTFNEFMRAKAYLEEIRDKAKKEGLFNLRRWAEESLQELSKKKIGEVIPRHEYLKKFYFPRKKAKRRFYSYLRRNFEKVAFFPEKYGEPLPDYVVPVYESDEGFKLYRDMKNPEKFYFFGRSVVIEEGKVYDLGEKVIGKWIVR